MLRKGLRAKYRRSDKLNATQGRKTRVQGNIKKQPPIAEKLNSSVESVRIIGGQLCYVLLKDDENLFQDQFVKFYNRRHPWYVK